MKVQLQKILFFSSVKNTKDRRRITKLPEDGMTSFLYCGGRQNTLLTTFPPRALGDVGSRNVETHILLTRSKCGWKLGNFVENIAESSRQFAINTLLGKVVKFHSNFFLQTKCLFIHDYFTIHFAASEFLPCSPHTPPLIP